MASTLVTRVYRRGCRLGGQGRCVLRHPPGTGDAATGTPPAHAWCAA